jgi:hypothetical protein
MYVDREIQYLTRGQKRYSEGNSVERKNGIFDTKLNET